MKTIFDELKGNQLRIIKFLNRNRKGSTFATRGHIVTPFYVSNRYPGNESQADEDIDYLISKNLIVKEDKNFWLTDSTIYQFEEYKKNETEQILKDIINSGYEFALLNYLNRRDEFISSTEFPKILENFAPFLNNFNLPSGMLIDNLFKLKNYIEEKNQWYKLKEFGKQYLETLISKQKAEKEKRKLENKILQDTVSTTKFQRNVTYVSLLVALFAGLIPLFIHFADRNKKVEVEIPEMKHLLQIQQSLQKNNQEIQFKVHNNDSLIKR